MKCKRLAFHAGVVSAFAVLAQFFLIASGYSPFENSIFLLYICCSWLAVIFCYFGKVVAAIMIGLLGTLPSALIGIPVLFSGASMVVKSFSDWSLSDLTVGILSSVPGFLAGAFLCSLFIHFLISGILRLIYYFRRRRAFGGESNELGKDE